jgi:hypothetical protein
MPGTAMDASELLDIDVDQFARDLALIALGGLQSEPAQLAHADPREDPRGRRDRPIEDLGDLRARKAQAAQRRDRLDRPLVAAIGDHAGSRRTINQPGQPLGPVARDPLRAGALAHLGRLRGLRDRPPLLDDTADHPLAPSE